MSWLLLSLLVPLSALAAIPPWPNASVVDYRTHCAKDSVNCETFPRDPLLGYRLGANLDAVFQEYVGNEVLAEYRVHTDFAGRRRTPVVDDRLAKKYAVFLGCSLTFGQAVPADQTYPAVFGAHAPQFRPYNYGVQGWGPNQWLVQLEKKNLRKEIPEKDGIGVLMLIDNHIRRIVPSLGYLSWPSARESPSYALDANGEPVFEGSYEEAHPIRTNLLGWLARFSQWAKIPMDWPPEGRATDNVLLVKMIQKISRLFREKFHTPHFYVVIHPGEYELGKLIPALQGGGTRVLDYRSLYDFRDPKYHLPDSHDSAAAYQAIGEQLARDVASDRI